MIPVRSALFLVLLSALTVALAIAGLFTLPLRRSVTYRIAVLWSKAATWLLRQVCGLGLRVIGAPAPDRTAVIYAIKHQSAWETVVFPHLVPPISIVLKRELLAIPFYGWYLRRLGMIPIDRTAGGAAIKAMVREARRQLSAGRSLLIMPEGTRMPPGRSGRYHPGVAALSSMLALPIVPVALNSGVFWGGRSFLIRPGVVTLEFLEPLPPQSDRAQLLTMLKDRIESTSENLLQEARERYGSRESE
jgi:1-acyl-sn-glycerol-3-phosphate acyltransferase